MPIIAGMEDRFVNACKPNPSDSRRYPRFQIHFPLTLEVSREETRPSPGETKPPTVSFSEPQAVSLEDVSLTGFYFTSDQPYPIGSHVRLHVAFEDCDYQIRALVQRSQANPRGPDLVYGIAVLFLRGGNIHAFLADVAAIVNHPPLCGKI